MPMITPVSGSDYSNVATVKNHAGISAANNTVDAWISSAITACSRAIDNTCRRKFYTETATRYYDFTDSRRLWLDVDLISVTTLTNGDGTVLVQNTDFLLWPYYGPPFARIDIKTDSGTPFVYSGTTQKAISVAGVWGYKAAVPSEVQQACKTWVADALNRRQVGGISSKTIGDYSVSFDQSVDEMPTQALILIKPLIRRRFPGA